MCLFIVFWWVMLAEGVYVCVRVCTRVCVPLYAPTQPPSLSPVSAVLFCFVSLLSPPVQETNTGSLCPPLDLPSVRGDQVGGKMLCRNVRPCPGSPASVASHYRTEVTFCFFAWVTNIHPVLSPFSVPFFAESTWDGSRGGVFGDSVSLATHSLVYKGCAD